MAKSELDSIYEIGKNARNQLIHELKQEDIIVTETFACSRYGEIKQGYEAVRYSSEVIYRLDLPKFVDQDSMLQAYILAFHLGIYKYEQRFNNLKGLKKEWHEMKKDFNHKRYLEAWTFAESWINTWLKNTFSPYDSSVIQDSLKADLFKAKQLTQTKSIFNILLRGSLDGFFEIIIKPFIYAYLASVFIWLLVNNGIPPFHLFLEVGDALSSGEFVLIYFMVWPMFLIFKLLLSQLNQKAPIQRSEPFLVTMRTKLDLNEPKTRIPTL